MLSTEAQLKPLTEETLENLRMAAGDPIDAMRLAADVYATNAYLAERARAAAAGAPWPKPPKPVSHYVKSFTADLKARLVELAAKLKPDELARLETIGASIIARLENNDTGLMETLLLLASMHPADAALWIRAHLDEIEARYLS